MDWLPSGHILAQVKDRNTRTRCGLYIEKINFEHISYLVLFLLLTLNMQLPAGSDIVTLKWIKRSLILQSEDLFPNKEMFVIFRVTLYLSMQHC